MNTVINPPELVEPVGYAHAIASSGGTTVYLAGQVSFDAEGRVIHEGDIVRQFEQALSHIQVTMRAAGGEMTDIVKLLIFVKDRNAYKQHLKDIGQVYRTFFGKYYPAMTLVEVSSLFDDGIMLEIEGIAVIH
jgi:enamine deaminase RidA (YjgF/YER057c/UK114 family)